MDQESIYIGNRYVPKLEGEWNQLKEYEGLSIVTLNGNSYTSKKMVPQGVAITNEEYWVKTGDYNVQVEEFKNELTIQLAQTKRDFDIAVNSLTVDSEVKLSRKSDTKSKEFTTLDLRLEEIETDNKLKANKVQENWIIPTLLNGWVTYSVDNVLRYRKDELGNIYINGRIKDGLTGTFPVFKLPSGYIPDRQYQSPINCGNAFGVGIVVANGEVWVFQGSNTSVFFNLKIPTL